MPRQEFSGHAVRTTLTALISDSATSLAIDANTGWPSGSVGPFVITIDRGEDNEERILATARSGTNLTGLTRGYDGTTAAEHALGAVVEHTASATKLDDLDDHVYDTGRDDHTQYMTNARHDARDHSAALATAALGDLGDVDSTAPSTGQTLTWDGDSWAPASATGLLAVVSYNPVGDTTVAPSDNLSADVDATNLAVAFTVPASGKVLVTLSGLVIMQPTNELQWLLREGSSDISGALAMVGGGVDANLRATVSFYVTGLTPGASKTYKWGQKVVTGVAGIPGTRYGGKYGQATMTVQAAP